MDLSFLTNEHADDLYYRTPWGYLGSFDQDLASKLGRVRAGVLDWDTSEPYIYLCRPMTVGLRPYPHKDKLMGVRTFDPSENGEATILKKAMFDLKLDSDDFGCALRRLDTFLARKAQAVFVDYGLPSVGVAFELIAAYSSDVPIYGIDSKEHVSAFYAGMISYVPSWEYALREIGILKE